MIVLVVGAVTINAQVTNDVVVGVADGTNFTLKVIRLDGAAGSAKWTYTAPIHNYPISAIGMNPVDQSVYMAIADDGFKLSSGGSALWGPVSFGNIPTPASFAFNPYTQSPYASGDCSHGWLAQINGIDGSLVWSTGSATSSFLNDIPSLSVGSNDGSLYGVAGNNGLLYKYSGSGSQISQTSVNWAVTSGDCNGGRGDYSKKDQVFYGAGGNTTSAYTSNYLYEFNQSGSTLATYSLPLNARVTGVAVDNAIGSTYYGDVYVTTGTVIYKFNSSLGLIFGPVDIGNTADYLAVDPLGGRIYVASIGGKFVKNLATFDGSTLWTYSTGSLAPSALSTQRLVEPYLNFSNSTATVVAYQCSLAMTVQVFDAQNNPVTTGVTINLTASDGTMNFFAANNCGGTNVTSVTIPSGSNSANFYFTDSTVGSPVVIASAIASGYSLATQAETIIWGPPFGITSDGKVGIATSTPSALFTIGNGLMVVTVDGKMGLGTSSPQATFDVSGKTHFGVVVATQSAGAAGSVTVASCPANTWALFGGCNCSGGTNLASMTSKPYPAPTAGGAAPTGWQCQGQGSTGAACAASVQCSYVTNQ